MKRSWLRVFLVVILLPLLASSASFRWITTASAVRIQFFIAIAWILLITVCWNVNVLQPFAFDSALPMRKRRSNFRIAIVTGVLMAAWTAWSYQSLTN